MRLDHAARLERLLARHPDIQLVTGSAGGDTLIRRDQLLVAAADSSRVHAAASRWIARTDDSGAPGVSVLHLRPEAKVDVLGLTESLSAGTRHKTANVGPNHIMTAGPESAGGPFDEPEPAGAVPSPPTHGDAPQRRVVVALLDTGIAEHAWFTGSGWFGQCGSDVREIPDADLDYALDSIAGHGTFIAGVVLAQAPQAELWPMRVIGADGVTDELRLLHGLAQLRARSAASGSAVDVVNLSLGCYTHDDKPSPVLEQAIRSLARASVVVACAGNSGSERPYWPAALKQVIAVGSTDASGTGRAGFSNFGWWVDACTLGDKVVSSFFSFDSDDGTTSRDFTGYASWSGTSFAAPRVAGAIAARAASGGGSAAAAAAELLDPANHPSLPDLGVLVDVPAS